MASADAVPYPDATFDKALSVHTLYFWPELSQPLREIARVLRSDGRLVLAHRTDPEASRDFPPPVYRFPSDDEVAAALEAAGLALLDLVHERFGHARCRGPFRRKKGRIERRRPARMGGSAQCDSRSSRRIWVLCSDVGSTHWSP
jgi:SAM-dependent methyltransferase